MIASEVAENGGRFADESMDLPGFTGYLACLFK